jgi:hypothetical protein
LCLDFTLILLQRNLGKGFVFILVTNFQRSNLNSFDNFSGCDEIDECLVIFLGFVDGWGWLV